MFGQLQLVFTSYTTSKRFRQSLRASVSRKDTYCFVRVRETENGTGTINESKTSFKKNSVIPVFDEGEIPLIQSRATHSVQRCKPEGVIRGNLSNQSHTIHEIPAVPPCLREPERPRTGGTASQHFNYLVLAESSVRDSAFCIIK